MKISSDAPIKYSLDLHLTDSHISPEGIIFEIVRYCIAQFKSSEIELDNVKFTSKTLKYVFGNRLDGEFKDLVVSSIKEYIGSGFIKPNNNSMYITKELITKFYDL
jgi:hypothetical protein